MDRFFLSDIASNNLKNQHVLFVGLLKMFGYALYVVLLAVEVTRRVMLSIIGKKHNTAIHLNWKLSVYGIMLGTTMCIG